MNFDEAVRAHSEWKTKLSHYIRKPDGSLKSAEVCLDNKCNLGQWIYGEGTAFTSLPEYATLKTEHAKFHKCAGSIISRADKGENVTEEVMLGAKSEYAVCSSNVVAAIMAMKIKAKK